MYLYNSIYNISRRTAVYPDIISWLAVKCTCSLDGVILFILNMALFNIQRYDSSEQVAQEEEYHKDEILQNLQRKIATKRRQIKVAVNEEVTQKNENEGLAKTDAIDKNVKGDVVETKKKNNKKTEAKKVKKNVDNENTGALEKRAADFEIIGMNAKKKHQEPVKVDMILPPWLAHPTIITGDMHSEDMTEDMSFLSPQLRQVLKEKLNIEHLFPVQRTVIPWIMRAHTRPLPFRPRDICVSAPTGSGKTLSFALPIVQLLAPRVERQIQALVVLPVAELALQIFKVMLKLTAQTDLVVQLLSKQMSLAKEQQQLVERINGKYVAKADIIVTTPGRLIDHLHGTNGFSLHALRFLVIDEADRIVDAAFQNWLQHFDVHMASQQPSAKIATHTLNRNNLMARVGQPHKLLFSATITQDPEKLQRLHLFHPLLFSASGLHDVHALQAHYEANGAPEGVLDNKDKVGKGGSNSRYVIPKELTQKYCLTEAQLKPLSLFSLIVVHSWRKFLCFTNSGESSERLAFVLNKLACNSLHFEHLSAQMSAKERASTLSNFARGKLDGLICSDGLARGIDIQHVDVIVSYDLPRHIKTYIHRIGRTARAGRHGTAVTLLTQNEMNSFKKLLSQLDKNVSKDLELSRATIEDEYATSYSKALVMLQKRIAQEKKTKLLQEKRVKNTNMLANNKPTANTFMDKLMQQIDTKMTNN